MNLFRSLLPKSEKEKIHDFRLNCGKGNVDQVTRFLNSSLGKRFNLHTNNIDFFNALKDAIYFGQIEIVKILLQNDTNLNFQDDEGKTLLKLMPFLETRRNIRWDIWEKESLGIEIGKDIFSWLYFGDSIQQVWAKEDYHDWYIPLYVKRDYMESVTRLCFTHNLLSVKNFKLKGFILDEFTFDFDRGAWLRNEVAIGIILPLSKYIEAKVNWGHIKRHNYDSDTAEASLSLVF